MPNNLNQYQETVLANYDGGRWKFLIPLGKIPNGFAFEDPVLEYILKELSEEAGCFSSHVAESSIAAVRDDLTVCLKALRKLKAVIKHKKDERDSYLSAD